METFAKVAVEGVKPVFDLGLGQISAHTLTWKVVQIGLVCGLLVGAAGGLFMMKKIAFKVMEYENSHFRSMNRYHEP
ncbi:unnamed protein product [Dibothriocephalus latus]|uniref:Uncharacterized protein n=1 Tax=Dibothriocephalus latus TaxID=60516 RepID=A0A3P6TFL3_DIBLA|nr:unnamed protein product [Dibothriocephalus latus]